MFKRRREYIEAFFCLILLFVTPLAVTWPAIIKGDAPVNLDALTLRAPWQEARVEGTMSDTDSADELIERYYPWYIFMNQAGKSGELPLWNPFEGLGTPFLALWRTRALSLFSAPFYLLPFAAAIAISVFLKLAIAGLSAYYVARRFQFSPPFALLVAVPFQLCGVFMAAHWLPISDIAPFFPLLLPCLQRLLLGDRRVWPYLALLVGMMTLSGDPESLAAIFIFMFFLAIVFGLRTYQRERIRGALIWLLLSGAIGITLAAVQLAPHIEFLSLGHLENKSVALFSFRDFSFLLAPPILSNGAFEDRLAALWLPSGLIGFLLLPLWLSLRPFAHRIRKRRIESFFMTTIITLALSAAFGPWLRRIPGLELIDATHFMIPFPLAMGLLAATTADEWVHLDAQKCKATLRKLIVLLPLIWGTGVIATFVLLISVSGEKPPLAPILPFLVLPPLASFLPVLACAAALLVILFITLLWPKPTLAAFSTSLVTASLLWFVYQPQDRLAPMSRIMVNTNFTQALLHENSRVAGTTQLQKWPVSIHGISQVYSPSGAVLKRNATFMEQAEKEPELLRLTASAQLLLTKADVREKFAALRPILNIKDVFPSGAILLKDLLANPRFRIVYAARQLKSGEPQPPLRAAGPPIIEGGTLPETTKDISNHQYSLMRNDFNNIEISVESGRPGILVFADSWYPGWHAFVDGAETPVFPVDTAFRGIEVSEGKHEIHFVYEPDSLRLGLFISAGAMLLVFLGLVTLFRTRHKVRPV